MLAPEDGGGYDEGLPRCEPRITSTLTRVLCKAATAAARQPVRQPRQAGIPRSTYPSGQADDGQAPVILKTLTVTDIEAGTEKTSNFLPEVGLHLVLPDAFHCSLVFCFYDSFPSFNATQDGSKIIR